MNVEKELQKRKWKEFLMSFKNRMAKLHYQEMRNSILTTAQNKKELTK
jgi:hypothetical protein